MLTALQLTGRDTSHLIEWRPGHWLQPDVAKALEKMQKAAQADGVGLDLVSSYRDCQRQLAIWNAKWLGQRPVLDINSQVLPMESLSDKQKLYAILTWSALPGASRHHWGTDMDLYDKASVQQSGRTFQLVSQEYAAEGPCYALCCWLDSYAEDFGFFRPYAKYQGGVAPEPWHFSHKASARLMQQQLSLTCLSDCIQALNIEGKRVILEHLPDIYRRFVQLPDEEKT
ncbi:M15 family metallopeptidase [Bowmanella denitrificans]|uniref:M15 family metallopeptidase n=1 Tax=Bowmanella denitrificans TaxID=366582 RepID=UPI000C99ECF7|nr:M15 family metallopeptidase [Bowmanella denitrificans]